MTREKNISFHSCGKISTYSSPSAPRWDTSTGTGGWAAGWLEVDHTTVRQVEGGGMFRKPEISASLLKVIFPIYSVYRGCCIREWGVDKWEHNVNKTLKYNFMTMSAWVVRYIFITSGGCWTIQTTTPIIPYYLCILLCRRKQKLHAEHLNLSLTCGHTSGVLRCHKSVVWSWSWSKM